MSAPVDVRAVIDRIFPMLVEFHPDHPRDLRAARAAVSDSAAELRAVSKEMRERMVGSGRGRGQSPTLIAWANRIDAALTRIGGAP